MYSFDQNPYWDHIAHYGVKGQKWGIRRYQNRNGSYTTAGLRRLRKDVKKTRKQVSKEKTEGRSKESTGKYYDEAERDVVEKRKAFNKKYDSRVDRLYNNSSARTFDRKIGDLTNQWFEEENRFWDWAEGRMTRAKLQDIGFTESEARDMSKWLRDSGYQIDPMSTTYLLLDTDTGRK